jgi:predicted GNAT family acetyltransferase
MSITRHTDPRAFLRAAADVLARDEGSASGVNAWVGNLIEHPLADDRCYLATYSGNGAIGFAYQRATYAAFVGHSDAEACAVLARDLAAEWPQLQGVAGACAACDAFARAWNEATGRAHRVRFRLRSHVLTEVIAPPHPGGTMRAAAPDDLRWLVDANTVFIIDAKLPDDPARAAKRMPQRIADGQIRVWDDGRPVAFAGWSPSTSAAARIAPVWTDAHARRRGFASALVAALARELLAQGRSKLFLDTDVANPTSNAIYARVGFRPLHDLYHYDFIDQ